MFNLDRLGDLFTGGASPVVNGVTSLIDKTGLIDKIGQLDRVGLVDALSQAGIDAGILDGLDQQGVTQLLTDIGLDPAQFDLSEFAGELFNNAGGGILGELSALMGQRDH